jgi:hypothetical protein
VARGQVTRVAAALALAALLAGCVTPPPTRYAWGGYEDLLYVAQARPGTLTAEAEIDQLEKDRALADANHQRLPPGWHAQLATLYLQAGRADHAREELLAEKTAFPESATLVDRLLANLAAAAAKSP